MIHHQTPNTLIEWHADVGCIFMRRTGFVPSPEFRLSGEKLLELAKQYNSSKLLSDVRTAKVFAAEDQQWVTQDWTPRAMAAGLKYHAVIIPESTLAKLGYDAFKSKVTSLGYTICYFTDIEAAKEWFRTLT
jgi:hypothetical protein